ncbi:MAG: exodeoxyribonuclease VII large subunit [Tannerellaceae bacterium]|nr:exodeoxyribonuclease VII large subunit [Tannerellaceae bacterium]
MMEEKREGLSLLELNSRIKKVIHGSLSETYWVRAEMADVRVNISSGHCYLELVEKHAITGRIMARARANIWAKTFAYIKPYFETETGREFSSGLEVLINVMVEYHEIYGISYTVIDIDPTYTLGEIVKKRMEIIRWLQEDGIFTLNQELIFPELPNRIAIITSPTAAGYEDFLTHLHGNSRGYAFHTKLFPALMQGEKVEESIIEALDRIYENLELFDLVVIIRGGGATVDLNCFDSYPLAANCAQFPLPVLTGIGHERDDTILDLVAHKRLKTPTAVAEFLIHFMDSVAFEITDLKQAVLESASEILDTEQKNIQLIGSRFPGITSNRIERERSVLGSIANHLQVATINLIARKKAEVVYEQTQLRQSTDKVITRNEQYLGLTEQFIKMVSPEYILKQGYSLVMKKGKIIKHASDLKSGDVVSICFDDGKVKGKIN